MFYVSEKIEVCNKFGAPFLECSLDLRIGISLNVKEGATPLHGLRIIPEEGTTGWFIWVGEYSTDPDFFKPVHVYHLREWCLWIIKYLALAPGWRFLVTPTYEDIWKDEAILNE